MNRFFIILSCALLQLTTLQAQDKQSPFSVSMELSSKYMWRGIEYGTAPVAFPMLSYTHKGFSAFAMGAYATDGSHQEVDLGVSYSTDFLTVGLSDYYYPTAVGTSDSYFEFSNRSTGHYVEAYATLTPFAKLPVWLTLSSYIYGADKNLEGDHAFSSYAEVGYTHSFSGDNALSLAVGAALNKSFYTDYDKGFNVVNVSLKYATSLTFGNFKLPVSASYILNPYKEKSYFTFSFYFD